MLPDTARLDDIRLICLENFTSKQGFLALRSFLFRSGLDSVMFQGVGWSNCVGLARKAWWAGHGAARLCVAKRTPSELDLNPAAV